MEHAKHSIDPAGHTRILTGMLVLVLAASATSLISCRPLGWTPRQPEDVLWADSTLNAMSIRQKVAQMVIAHVPSEGALKDPTRRGTLQKWVRQVGIGGVIFLAGEPVEQAALTTWLQQQADVPLFVAQDMEWGAAMRLSEMTQFPRAMALAATADPRSAMTAGNRTGRQARSVGVNMVLAPVADVNTEQGNSLIGTRSFGDNPETVADFAAAFARSVRAHDVLPVAKHFPGHGGTLEDSHNTLPVARRDSAGFFEIDLVPFRRLIGEGDAALMTGHILPSGHAYSDTVAATLSHRIVSDLLRDSLAYEGLTVTDALNMEGVRTNRSDAQVYVDAVRAGADLLLMPPDPVEAVVTILNAVREGKISESRIEDSARRILIQKAKLGLHRRAAADLDEVVKAMANKQADLESLILARRSIVLLGEPGPLPLMGSNADILAIAVDHRTGEPDGFPPFARTLSAGVSGTVLNRTWSPRSGSSPSASIVRDASQSDLVIVADYTASTSVRGWNTLRFLEELGASDRPVVYVSFGAPFHSDPLIDVADAILVGWDDSPAMGRATAEALLGMATVCGRLPVRVSTRLSRGMGRCLPKSAPSLTMPDIAGMDPDALRDIDRIVRSAIADSAFPAAALVVGRGRHIAKLDIYGSHTYDFETSLSIDDRFDMASVTKVVATTTAVMKLYEAGRLELDRPVADYLPSFAENGKGPVTIRDLLTHTGGLIPFRPYYRLGVRTASGIRSEILSDSLDYFPGTDYRYSDFGPITLAWVVEEITDRSFDEYLQSEVFEPLGMLNTGFRPNRKSTQSEYVPTEEDDYFRNRLIRGEVHDENAWILGGVAGHAGLFSTAEDMARFASMLVSGGRLAGRQFLRPETIRLFTTKVDSLYRHTRALGWDTRSPRGYSSAGQYFGPRSFGHTGFTGTSIWIDPDQNLYVILLTNRVHPTREGRGHIAVRPAVADKAFEALSRRGE